MTISKDQAKELFKRVEQYNLAFVKVSILEAAKTDSATLFDAQVTLSQAKRDWLWYVDSLTERVQP